MSKKIILFLVGLVLFSSYNLAYAGLVINEIMYDLEDADTGREWVEIYNNSDTAVDVSAFKFFEANTNHGLTLVEGDANIGAYGYAVIVSDSEKFKIDWPNFPGTIFDSSFSLSNDGEALAIKDESLNIVDEYTYSSSQGANGDGNSLQKISGSWSVATSTPGIANETVLPPSPPPIVPNNSEGSSGGGGSSPNVTENKTKAEIPKIKTKIITKTIAFVGVPVSFEALAFGYNGEKLFSGKYFWNFGDGDSVELKGSDINNQKFTHTYFYPGEYVVNLEYYTNHYGDVPDASDKVIIKVVSADILISGVGDEKDFFIELSNNTNYDADISKWILSSDKKSFVLPKNTIIGSKKKIIISPKITNFSILDKETLKLMNSQGNKIFDYQSPIAPVVTILPTKTADEIIVQPKISASENSKVVEPLGIAPAPADQIPVENLPALAIQSDIVKNEWNATIIVYFVSIIFIGASASAVYFLRRKKVVSNAGDDFNILDE
ncbi:hypothetical protein A2641_00940 [Candidatus Nomurabacteria bacterium RIFCSPHIGHO2_01_FULL_37_25]|uniref:PKD domain-containing protein n=1 Tax=Candidatus Nomurabacteria bacterium RIFCSPLOWO2_01_FULL_36_16 TaxID=1801767 RepID=A0A1F6WXR6_9BACT|nr:MAG: hypothetical protein A2641_00940 [Candidatus Nomurabacteria bacterium RIFCSPHIGHO2_01_FULL_37_25]OGI74959.1 MAG: hypothetical protein A3D36_01545 [Candidatus Nomurabacteria bacterium RIFCSPHIGHO2_02_FULL_36_29]OGI86672.1 MAG: hypothetical protein A3A91_03110 [Candidatus Nomurabacteria bacterium RIFCSPLOWO2_01_FULL_36_16]